MQICGQEVNIEDLKQKTSELEKLMNDPAVLSSIEAKVAEANEKIAAFKPEIPEVPNIQEALSKLDDTLSSQEFAAQLKKIKQDFGGVVEDLPDILNKANSKINAFLDDLPSVDDLTKLTDGSVVGIDLLNLTAKVAQAELKLEEKLARVGRPTVDPTVICDQVPNIEVDTKTIDVQELQTKFVGGAPVLDTITGDPVKELVTVQKVVKEKVQLPKEPVIPKEIPIKSLAKPLQKLRDIDPNVESKKVYRRAVKDAVKQYKRDTAKKTDGDKKKAKKIVFAQLLFFYLETGRVFGYSGTDQEVYDEMMFRDFRPRRMLITVEEASTLIPPSDRKIVFKAAKTAYELDAISETDSWEEIHKIYYLELNYKQREAVSSGVSDGFASNFPGSF